jgi:hypothetical protein
LIGLAARDERQQHGEIDQARDGKPEEEPNCGRQLRKCLQDVPLLVIYVNLRATRGFYSATLSPVA